MKVVRFLSSYLLSFYLFVILPVHALDSQGNLAVAGFVETDLYDLRDTLFSVTQYNPSGMLNTNFGNGGLATLPFFHGVAMDLFVDADDKVVVVGAAIDPNVGLPRALVARFDNNGILDTTLFNAPHGFVWLADAPSVANGIDISFDGSNYVVCGSSILNGRYYGFFSEVSADDGSIEDLQITAPDIKLNTVVHPGLPVCAGKKITHGIPKPLILIPTVTSIVLDINGELLDSALTFSEDETVYFAGTHANKGLLIKAGPAGLRTSFGSQGYVIAEFGNKQTVFNAIKVDESTNPERIMVCGTARGLQSRMFVAAYDPSGNLVPTFGDNGVMTLFEGPNIQTIGRDLVLQNLNVPASPLSCPSGSKTGMFAIGSANGRTPLIANLSCSGGFLKTEYGDKAVASLATEELTAMTVLKEAEPTGDSLPTPDSSPFAREFNALLGNPFAVNLTGSGSGAGFVLQPGRYYLDAQAPIQDVATHQLALYNDVLGINEALGDSIWNSSGILTKALLKGQLFVSEPTKYILRHYFSGTGPAFTIGQAANLPGLEEVYAQMNIQQL